MPRWLALLLALAAGLLAGWAGGQLVGLAARRPLRRGAYPEGTSSRLAVPVGLAVGITVCALALRAAGVASLRRVLEPRLWVPVLVAWMVVIGIDLAWVRVGKRHPRQRPGLTAALLLGRRLGKALVIAVASALVLHALGVPLGGLFVATGVLGAAVALAAREVMRDLFAFLSLLLDPPFLVGDLVRLTHIRGGPDTVGRVERIGLSSTVLQTRGRSLVSFANALILAEMRIENLSARDRRRLRFGVALFRGVSAAGLEELCVELEEKVAALPQLDRQRRARVWVSAASGAARLEIEAWMTSREREVRRAAEQQATIVVMRELERHTSPPGDGPARASS